MTDARFSEGKIIRGVGGFYYISDSEGRIHECRARGIFRKKGITPLIGDNVYFSVGGFIEEIGVRKNELKRPRVANIDLAAIVVSAEKPEIDYMLCDKLLIHIKSANIRPLLIINKCDAADTDCIEKISNEYKNACETVRVSASTGMGLKDLSKALSGSCTCMAGQSAAGKSSILNALSPGLKLETGGLSRKTDRGIHTTRTARLLTIEGISGTIVDTPGFSALEALQIPPEQLSAYYDDMLYFSGRCRFSMCVHENEPDCAVKEAVKHNMLSSTRYERYLEILKEIKEMRLTRYD